MIKVKVDLSSFQSYSKLFNALDNYYNANNDIVIRVKNTKVITTNFINKIRSRYGDNRINVQIISAYDDELLKRYPHEFLRNSNIYSLLETKRIIEELNLIEEGLDNSWDDFQKLVYFISQIKTKIIYHPFYEKQNSKSIRSLVGLFTKKTVCAGYALILKELCDRNNVECHYVLGATNENDAKRDATTHAWNIVRLNGNLIPIDLTWNAGKAKEGRFFSVDDLGNVNEFVKKHFTTSKEPIQNYESNLKSIEGDKLRVADVLVNKNITYDNTVVDWVRPKDNSRFTITLVGEQVIDKQYVYKYVYEKRKDDGTFGPPFIIYSKTNICNIVEIMRHRRKLQNSLSSAKTDEEKKRIIKKLNKTKIHEEIYKSLELLLSKENINAAIKRKDFYLGKIEIDKSKDNPFVDGVYVDPNFGSKIPYKQASFKRRDASTFIIEYAGSPSFGDAKFNKYNIFEPTTINGKRVCKKNVIFTDIREDLLRDNRREIVNEFLSRSRIDRKSKSTGGYLGYLDENNSIKYIPEYNTLFKDTIFKVNTLHSSDVLNYYETISFEEMKRLVKSYERVNIKGVVKYINRYTKKEVLDATINEHLNFSYLWLTAAGSKVYFGEEPEGFTYAFNEGSEEIFGEITGYINNSIKRSGVIDVISILREIKKSSLYKYATDIVIKMFTGKRNAEIIEKLYKSQNPSARRKVKVINYIDGVGFSSDIAYYNMLYEAEKQMEKEKDSWLEVTENNSGYEIKSRRKKKI